MLDEDAFAIGIPAGDMSTDHAILLGFDYGERRIGVAVGQGLIQTATPLTTLANRNARPDWQAITNLIREWQPDALIVGYPASSEPNSITTSIAGFCRGLHGRFSLPVYTVDESHTSIEARERIRAARALGTRKKTLKGDVDQFAAAVLLEAWMASRKRKADAD